MVNWEDILWSSHIPVVPMAPLIGTTLVLISGVINTTVLRIASVGKNTNIAKMLIIGINIKHPEIM